MVESSKTCPKCQGATEPGFIPDVSYGAGLKAAWLEGVPDKGVFGSLKTRGKRRIDITTHRCTSCGYLESYARQ